MLMATDWRGDYGLPDDVVKSGCAVSGLFDLEPFQYSWLQPKLRLTAEEIAQIGIADAAPDQAQSADLPRLLNNSKCEQVSADDDFTFASGVELVGCQVLIWRLRQHVQRAPDFSTDTEDALDKSPF